MKSSDPLLLADGTLRCRMYPAGKVAISQTKSPPGSPSVTILSASPVQTLAFIEMKHNRPPDLKSSSNASLPFAWIAGPATPACKFLMLPRTLKWGILGAHTINLKIFIKVLEKNQCNFLLCMSLCLCFFVFVFWFVIVVLNCFVLLSFFVLFFWLFCVFFCFCFLICDCVSELLCVVVLFCVIFLAFLCVQYFLYWTKLRVYSQNKKNANDNKNILIKNKT